jgi:hypothetical protein
MARQHQNEVRRSDAVVNKTLQNFKTKIGKEYSTKGTSAK